MIQHNIRNTFHTAVPGNSNRWQRQRTINKGIHRNETYDTAIQQKMRVGIEERGVVTVSDGEKKEILLPEVPLNAADDWRAVKVTNFLGDHADHIGALDA